MAAPAVMLFHASLHPEPEGSETMTVTELPTNGDLLRTAAEHLTGDVPVVNPTTSIEEARAQVIGHRFDSVRDIAVCEQTQLVGLVRIEDLLAAPPTALVSEVMDPDPPFVGHGVDQEIAAWTMIRHAESSLAVVDERDRFLGLIPPHTMLEVLLEEHEEDLARLGGFLRRTREARLAGEEGLSRRLVHRLPWLLVGLAGAFLSAVLVGGFEEQLEETVELAFFLPALVYLADAVGTQTETLIVRGLSVGVRVRTFVHRELATGALIGLILAAASYPFAALLTGQQDVALTVAITMFAACGSATLAAMSLPFGLARMGLDPAFGSGPLVTIVQDLFSLVIYMLVATLVL